MSNLRDIIDRQEREILQLRSDNSTLQAQLSEERQRRREAEAKLREAQSAKRR